MATAAYLQQAYVAYFGRPADTTGLAAFANATNAQVQAAFAASAESIALYGTTVDANFINNIYLNVLGRAAEPAGITYWLNQIAIGNVTQAGAAIAILNGAQGTDVTTVNNKIAAATLYTAGLDTNPEIIAYTGTAAAASARSFLAGITSTAATSDQVNAAIVNMVAVGGAVGTTYALTTGVDTIVGTSGNDIVNGQLGGTATLTALDSIDGGAGTDTLNISDVVGNTALPSGLTVKNVEVINLKSGGIANIDTSSATAFVGVTNLNVTTSTGADTVTAGAGQAVSVVDTAGLVTLVGGTTQTVTTAGGYALSKGTGAITVTDTAQAAVASSINGGTNVTLTTTATNPGGTTGAITIGGTTAPTGTVTVTDNLTNVAAAASNVTGGAISITGGTAVTVTETATQAVMTTASTNSTITQAAVGVTGTSATTAVTVNQAAAVAAVNTVLAVTGVTESDSVVFGALTAGSTIILGGLTLTAPAGGLTAKQVAAAFANLSAGGALTGWSTGAVSGTNSDTVTFTSSAAGNVVDLADTGTGAATTITKTEGVAAVTATGKGGIAQGVVTIADANAGTATANTIASVTLSNYANSTINSNALATLSLSGTAVGTLGITNTTTKTLDLTVNGLGGANTITNNTYTTLKIHTTGANSTLANIVDSAATALTVDGTNALTFTSAAGLSSLKTVTISGSAGVTGDFSAASVTGVDTSATTGNSTVIIDATKATFTGGAGNDTVTIAAAPTKAISGGTGADTLVVNIAGGFNASGNAYITGFETLGLGALATGTYDATGFTGLTEGAVAGAVTYTNVAAGAALTITASPTAATVYTLKDATGTTDVLTLNLKASGAAIAAGSITAASIETVNINATDSSTTAKAGATADSVTLVATSATTETITGNTTLTLVNTGNTKLTLVDASGMTGGLTYTTAGTVAETVKGGATANALTAVAGTVGDTLIGQTANDTITANAGADTLTGGGGNDTFVVATVSASVNVYSTITDFSAGDVLQLANKGVETFTSAKVTLAATAVFQDYANAVVQAGGNASVNGAIGWFQYNGDTYIVESMHDGSGAGTPSFVNGTDLVVKLTGLIDLSGAAYLQNGTAPEIVGR